MTTTPKADRILDAHLDDGKPNWDWIEEEYRAGQLSIRAIAKASGAPKSTVYSTAKREDWTRDLAEDVRARVRRKQIEVDARDGSTAPDGGPAPDQALSDEEITERAAARTLTILGEHRKAIADARALVSGLVDDLLNNAEARAKVEGKEQAIIIDAACRAVRSLSGALKDLIGLERQALNLDEQEREPDRPLDYIPLAERIKYYTQIDNGEGAKVVPLHGPEGDGAI